MKIGELAAQTGTPVETIRFYERAGLLPAASRSAGNYRIYESRHAQRLAFVRHCRSLDMTLSEVRLLLAFVDSPDQNCGEVNLLLDTRIEQVTERIRALRDLERDLKDLRRLCTKEQTAGECRILRELAARDGSEGRVDLTTSSSPLKAASTAPPAKRRRSALQRR